MPATTNAHSLRSVPATTSSKSGSAPTNSIHGVATHNHHGQVASAPAFISHGSGRTIVNNAHLGVTLGASSPNPAPGMNENHPRSLASENPTKNAKPATGEKVFDFKYKNVYTTPPVRSGGRTTRGRATIGSGSGAGSGVGSCSLM